MPAPSAPPSWWPSSSSYSQVSNTDTDDDVDNHRPKPEYTDKHRESPINTLPQLKGDPVETTGWGLVTALSVIALVTLLVFAVGGAASFLTTGPAQGSAMNSRPCGNSSAEARANGCVFNQLTWSWIPKSCPSYADKEFKEYRDWKYYADLQGDVPANDDIWEKVYNNEMRLYTVKGEHMTHCVHLLLSMAQVVRDGSPTIPKLREYDHIKHCADHLLMKLSMLPDFDKIGTKTPLVSYEQSCSAGDKRR